MLFGAVMEIYEEDGRYFFYVEDSVWGTYQWREWIPRIMPGLIKEGDSILWDCSGLTFWKELEIGKTSKCESPY